MFGNFVRKRLSKVLTGQTETVLEAKIPTREELGRRYAEIDELGIYLHIPFCRQVCPYCPYNKELFCRDTAQRYANAVNKEIDYYSDTIGKRTITSLYIGGGTPTSMLGNGLAEILEHLHAAFDICCDVHMESHPNDLTEASLDAITAMGVQHLSTGVESLQEQHLKFLKRPYSVDRAKEAVRMAVARDFKCVNVDIIFALPGQTYRDVEQAGHDLVDMGVDQVAAYPLFRFPYTVMGSNGQTTNYGTRTVFKRRKMLRILEKIFYSSGFDRSSVWAFTKKGVPRYCSVTVPLYLGLGASGGSYLRDAFYLNTFNVAEYIQSVEDRGTAIALSLEMSERMQMAGWLYWRIYETRFQKTDFRRRFGLEFDRVYGKYLRPLRLLGFLRDDGDRVVLTDKGSYWLHALEDVFSIEYISRLWGTSKNDPWPERVAL